MLYPVTVADSKGRTLNSDEDYVLHFEKGQLPPANAFWSLHVYNNQHGFAANPANRYVLRSDGLKYNADGSLDVYIQRRDPGERKRANWLSAPASDGPFLLSMRLYWPQDLALDGFGRRRRCAATEARTAQAGRAPIPCGARFSVVAGSCARFGWGLEARGWAPLRGDFGWDES